MFKCATILIITIINVQCQNDKVNPCESNRSSVDICLPLHQQETPVNRQKINLDKNLKCTVANSNKTGIIKFLSDCPGLNSANAKEHTNLLCTDEICSDLVCCPITPTSRLKDVCWYVDHPSDTLRLRLLLNLECTINDLNIKGRYQKKCDYAKRNPSVASKLKNVCKYSECADWYCCPIEEEDAFQCTGLRIDDSTATLVGPKCIDSKSGNNGTCRKESNCAHDVSTLDECGSYCCTKYYCCPDDQNEIIESISSRECHSYTKYLSKKEIEVPMNLYKEKSSCSAISTSTGATALPGEFPYMAALGYIPIENVLWNCSGSLISDRYVLTAGHCLIDRYLGAVQKVRLGVIDLLNINPWDCPEDFDVAKLVPHPEYDPKLVYNDIGLIELAAQVKFNFHIRPICLPQSPDIIKDYVSMGWGAVGGDDNPSVGLIKVYQDLLEYDECQMQFDKGEEYPNGITDDSQICTSSRISIQSLCPEDTGRPLIKYERNRNSLLYIQGIVSFGTACGLNNNTVVHTKVYPHVKWIEETVWKI